MSNAVRQEMVPGVWHPATQQSAFRQIMQAFAQPGDIQQLCEDAQLLTLASLLDGAVTLADPEKLVLPLDLARLETRMVMPERAKFVLLHGAQPPAFTPLLGTLESPEQGATLLLVIEALGSGQPLRLSGPGIAGVREVAISGLHPAWLLAREDWNAAFPLGVDMLLLTKNKLMALPRTTRIEGFQSWDM